MAVMFHSAQLSAHERADALKSVFLDQSWPQDVAIGNPTATDAVLEASAIGRTSVFQAHITGITLSRTSKQIRASPSDMLAVARQRRSVGRHDQFGVQREVCPGELMVMDMNAPYSFGWDGPGASQALYVPIEELGLAHEVIARASSRLPASPLYALISSHIADLAAAGDSLTNTPAARDVDGATIDLARALLASAYNADYARGMMAEVLLPRIRGYIRQHLSDTSLSPDRIARAHDISTRKLFRLCEDADFSLEQWIITSRLEGSRDELTRPETQGVPIATIARRWGFSNPSYFTRRFREMYGVTPRAWRDIAAHEDRSR
ncbi:helix-turn-helix domain-containing protein [Williamsia sp.]|uniref:helix-turn-helix domain-containing protein n=1 Tax=Williamsia sp. TaxID=1872085 RepID=UPI002F92005F